MTGREHHPVGLHRDHMKRRLPPGDDRDADDRVGRRGFEVDDERRGLA